MKKRIWELCKDAIIALLLCSLVLLAAASIPMSTVRSTPWLSTIMRPFAPLLGLPQAELTFVETELPVLDAAQPLAISVRGSAGRSTAIWNFSALDAAFEQLGGALGEALDTAGSFSECTPRQLQSALSSSSVYFDYGSALPAALLASWLDATLEVDAPDAAVFVLALEADSVTLYLLGDVCVCASTQVQPQALETLLEQFRPDGSAFGFEENSRLASLSLLPGVTPTVYTAAAVNPCDSRFVEQLATELDFNPYGDGSYTDSQGVSHFSETNCALQISTAGKLLLTSTADDRFLAADSSVESLVEEARRLLNLSLEHVAGDARLYLTGLHRDGEETVCSFNYILNGVPVVLPGGDAASVSFSGNALTRLELQLTACTLTAEEIYLIPIPQTAAILPAGSRLVLEYHPTTVDILTPGWVS